MFKTRLFSGIILLTVTISLFLVGGVPLGTVLFCISCIGWHELCSALSGNTQARKVDGLEIAGMLGSAGLYAVIMFTSNPVFELMCIVGTVLLILLIYVVRFPKYTVDQVLANVFSLLYLPVLLSFIYVLRNMEGYGLYLVWLVLICSWGCDTFAYCVGKLIGKHKIFPVLSPNKSLEGCIGGVLGAALLGFLYGFLYVSPATGNSDFSWMLAVLCGVGGLIGMLGDLAASGIKRNKGIKDYGRLIPGHGGIVDRFDSTIVCAPIIYLLFILFM